MHPGCTLSFMRRLAVKRYPFPRRFCATNHLKAAEIKEPPPLSVSQDSKAPVVKKYYGYCHGHSYDMNLLCDYFSEQSTYSIEELPKENRNILLVSFPGGAEKPGLIFFFCRYGTCVNWDIPNEVMNELRKEPAWGKIVEKKYDFTMTEEEIDSFDYIENDTETSFSKGTVTLNSSLSKERQIQEKLAFSYALAQSVRLAVVEKDINEFFQTLRSFPKYFENPTFFSWLLDLYLKRKTSLNWLRNEAARKISGLHQCRFELLIDLDLRDEPDFFWDREHLEKFYNAMRQDLDILKRLDILIAKIDSSLTLAQDLHNLMSGLYSDRLEIMIILLISVEVVQSAIFIYISYS